MLSNYSALCHLERSGEIWFVRWLFSTKIKSLNIRSLSDIEYDEKSDGSGTITVGPKNPMMMFGNGMKVFPWANGTPSLEMIQNVRKVYNQIIEIQRRK